jgi:hypothetical protein
MNLHVKNPPSARDLSPATDGQASAPGAPSVRLKPYVQSTATPCGLILGSTQTLPVDSQAHRASRSRAKHRLPRGQSNYVDFDSVRQCARLNALAICVRLLPGGRLCGVEYVVKNPKRPDRTLGSFSINVQTGAWADFATGDKGRDIIGLVAFLFDLPRVTAAQKLAFLLRLSGETQHDHA